MVSQLPNSEESPTEFVIAESGPLVAFTALTNSNFEFMLCPRISDELPIVDAFVKGNVAKECAEEVVVFF
jgi:hypothetical protein